MRVWVSFACAPHTSRAAATPPPTPPPTPSAALVRAVRPFDEAAVSGDGLGTGARFARAVRRGDVALELRGSALVTARACARARWARALAKRWRETRVMGDDADEVRDGARDLRCLALDETLVCCRLALERAKGASSALAAYARALPTLEDFQRRVPLVMPMDAFVRLFGREAGETAGAATTGRDADVVALARERRTIERQLVCTHRHVVSKVDFRSEFEDGASDGISEDAFRWAHACVMTRAFHAPNAMSNDPWRDLCERTDFVGVFLAPVLDFANHRRPREVAYEVTNGEDGEGLVTVTALKDFKEGDFMRISYGAKDNTSLFSRYGFCVESNVEPDGSSNDVFRVDKSDFRRFVRESDEEHADGEVVGLRMAKTVDYMYAPFAELLDIARVYFIQSDISFAQICADQDAPAERDDAVWDCDEDVFGLEGGEADDADEANALMYGDIDDADDDDANGAGHEDHTDAFASRADDAARLRVEVKSLRALAEYLSTLQLERKEDEPSRDADTNPLSAYVLHQLKIWRSLRRRTLDTYALAARQRADDLLVKTSGFEDRRPHKRAKNASDDDDSFKLTESQRVAFAALDARLEDDAEAKSAAGVICDARARVHGVLFDST